MSRISATDGDRTLDNPSPEQLHDLLADMNLTDNFVVVEDTNSNGNYFIQVALDADPPYGGYTVEYRDGGPDAHFQATVLRESDWGSVFDPGFERVVSVVCDWAAGGRSWRSALEWRVLDLKREEAR
ncbi:uncharacterized protein BJX67DRAFT_383805 [Aspergillus lucknowensis]|uniref:Uncharacterized protein n=1 Tax=Aspergillus lucknowensis TaxID=176173 RepID=A0ABR4LIK7_9EURO